MKLCKNCHKVNEDEAISCIHCSMKGRWVPYQSMKSPGSEKVKNLHRKCGNCGTIEIGNGNRCARCNFPMPEAKTSSGEVDTGTNIRKQQHN